MSSSQILHTTIGESVHEYQVRLKQNLSQIFQPEQVKTEWAAMSDEKNLYSPRLDAAIGPFATNRIYIDEYNHLVMQHKQLLSHLFEIHRSN